MNPSEGPSTARRAVAGDREAVAALWREHRRFVAVVLLAHKPPGADLEDLLQEVALAFVQQIHRLREPSKVRSWLRVIAVHTARTAARRERTRRPFHLPLGVEGQIPDPRGPGGGTDAGDPRAEARRALALVRGLPLDYREPLLLRCLHGLTQKQIAEALGLTVHGVETRLARARRVLRERLRGKTESFPATRSQQTS
ncbi:MAG: RNA polymerase sigma factor [Planctomycetota bacterium]